MNNAGARALALDPGCDVCDGDIQGGGVCAKCREDERVAPAIAVRTWADKARLLQGMPPEVAEWFERCAEDLEAEGV